MKMNPLVWAIKGFKIETFDSASLETKVQPDRDIGQLNGIVQTIMNGSTWVDDNKSIGHAYLKVSLQEMGEFEKLPLAERGLGAVSGGYILSSNTTSSEPLKTEQTWGVVDASTAILVCGFYGHGDRYIRIMACFDRTNVAPISGFWRDGKVMVGRNLECNQVHWGRNLKYGSYAVALERGKLWIIVWLPLIVLEVYFESFFVYYI